MADPTPRASRRMLGVALAAAIVALAHAPSPLLAIPRAEAVGRAGLPSLFLETGGGEWQSLGGGTVATVRPSSVQFRHAGGSLTMQFEGAEPDASIEGEGASLTRVNRIFGNRPELWRMGQAGFGAVRIRNVYAGIDFVLAGAGGDYKSEFIVSPGADPAAIRLRYEGGERVRIEPGGGLRISAAGGDWIEDRPALYQPGATAAAHTHVDGRFMIDELGRVGFETGDYDRTRDLVIDPEIAFSSLIESQSSTTAKGLAVDAAGNLYVAGYTDGNGLPTAGPIAARGAGVDAFLIKIRAGGSAIEYAAYLGGSGDDRAFAVSVDPAGAAYVTGWTTSADFPLRNASQAALSGYRDTFLLRISPAGDVIEFSTYFGGSGVEAANALRADTTGVWLAGETDSANLPLLGAYQATLRGTTDGFLARFSAAGVRLSSTYLGGTGDETIRAVTTDAAGNVYAGGGSNSPDVGFPMNAFQRLPAGGQDAAIWKLDPAGAQLLAGTFLGGTLGGVPSELEIVHGLAVDSTGAVVAGGRTPSMNFPLRLAWRGVFTGALMGFVTKLDSNLTVLSWSTFAGGGSDDSIDAIALDGADRVYAGGRTSSVDFPLASPIQSTYRGSGDAFIVRFSSDGSALEFGTFLGGAGSDGLTAMAMGPAGKLAAAGTSSSTDFPLVNALFPVSGTRMRTFITELRFSGSPPEVAQVTPSAGGGSAQDFEFVFRDADGGSDIAMALALLNKSLTAQNGCFVAVDRASRKISLLNDAGTTWEEAQAGGAAVLSNSQCDVRAATSSVSIAGNEFRLRLALSFKNAFAGTSGIWAMAADAQGQATGWTSIGNYAVSGPANPAPSKGSVSPSAGSGTSQIFTISTTDAGGGTDVTHAWILLNAGLTGAGGCFVHIERQSGKVYLADDGGSAWSFVQAGSADTAENSQCLLRGQNTSTGASGTTASFQVNLEFKRSWAGEKALYASFADSGGNVTNWAQLGTYVVTSPAGLAPQSSGLSPASGSGSGGVFTMGFSDGNGGADISTVVLLINSAYSGSQGCFVVVEPGASRLYLASDNASVWSGAVLGQSLTLQNSQCLLRLASSSVNVSGNLLTVSLDIGFRTGFLGAKSIWGHAGDKGGLSSPLYQLLGSYTVTGSQASSASPEKEPKGSGGLRAGLLGLPECPSPYDQAEQVREHQHDIAELDQAGAQQSNRLADRFTSHLQAQP